MRNKQKGLPETALAGRPRKVANGHRVFRERMQPSCSHPTPDLEKSADPTIWEYTLGQQVSEARAACLQGLSRIPNGLGKLAYLAILQHRLLADHEELFEEWLRCSLQHQYELLHRSLPGGDGGTLNDTWLNPSVYSELIPASAEKTARTAYLANLGALLEILKKELPASSSGPREEALLKG